MAYRNYPQHRRSNVYSPVFTAVANLDGAPVEVAPFTYSIDGDGRVSVSGQATIDPTAAALSSFRVSLPPDALANFAGAGEVAGHCGNELMAGDVVADDTNDEALARCTAPDGSADVVTVSFSYQA